VTGIGEGLELRVVTADDWRLWRALRLGALADAPYAFGSRLRDWQDAPEERWRERLELPGSHNLMAFRAGAPAGMATGIPGDAADSVQLISMYVGPSARGLGVGSVLLDAVEQWAVASGADRLLLHVVATNDPARRLYGRHGLVVTGEVHRESPDDPLELEMCKQLDVGRARGQDAPGRG